MLRAGGPPDSFTVTTIETPRLVSFKQSDGYGSTPSTPTGASNFKRSSYSSASSYTNAEPHPPSPARNRGHSLPNSNLLQNPIASSITPYDEKPETPKPNINVIPPSSVTKTKESEYISELKETMKNLKHELVYFHIFLIR